MPTNWVLLQAHGSRINPRKFEATAHWTRDEITNALPETNRMSPRTQPSATLPGVQLVAWLSSILATLDGSGDAPPRPAPGRNPVVVVHGIHSSSKDMIRMAQYLRREGWEVFTPDMSPADGQVPLDHLASQLATYIDQHVAGRRFDLVGYSMGGLITRYYIQRLGGLQSVDRFVTIAAPHHGTCLANFNRRPGGQQMRPGSDFLRDLARDSDRLGPVQFTSFYTPLDLIIVPARSSEMPEASNVRLWAASHPSLILQKRCIRAVAKALMETPLPPPQALDRTTECRPDVRTSSVAERVARVPPQRESPR